MSLPILCYHNVAPAQEAGRRLNIEPDVLDSHVRHFMRRGIRFLRAMDLADPWPLKGVCLTFDDAYATMLDYGADILLRNGATASIYAVTALVGGRSVWDVGHEQPLATEDQLRHASHAGLEIGNHTRSHADLSSLLRDEQLNELRDAQTALREWGLLSGSVAYPFGKFNEGSLESAASIGYRVALALSRRQAQSNDRLLALPRIVVGYSDRLPKLLYKIKLRPLLPVFRKREHYV